MPSYLYSESDMILNKNLFFGEGSELKKDGRLMPHLQGMYVLALQMDMVPETLQAAVLARLVELIEDNGCRLDTGFLSVPFIMDVLYKFGREDLAYRLLYQTRCPSWLFEVGSGDFTFRYPFTMAVNPVK